MKRPVFAAFVLVIATGTALAQGTQVDLKTLPATIKSLDWKSVDWKASSTMEQTRALILLCDVLDEMGSQMAAEADLMSQYIDEQNLGEQFAAQPALEDKHLTMEEAQRVAVAMLRGPLADSSYSAMIGDMTGNQLTAYLNMYTSTCSREWTAAAESRQHMKAMARFLESSEKTAAFKQWVPEAMERQKQEQEVQKAAKRAEALELQKQKEEERKQAAQERKEELQKQREQERQASLQMQQAMSAAQAQAPVVSETTNAYPDWYYGGLGYATGTWYRDQAYRGAAIARTENRMRTWGGGGMRGGRGRGGRR